MTKAPLFIFCDFDGTVARADVGYRLFHKFSGGKNDELIPDWKAGRISSREILTREAAMVHASAKEILAFVDQMELDPGFSEFVVLARANGVEPVILSEGLDFYIEHLLHKYDIDGLTLLTNKGHLENNGIRIEFPHTNRECKGCGSCKGERIDEYREKAGDGRKVVFVGDGYSDACAAKRTDILFAKKDLAEYCTTNGIPFIPFDTFHDVARELLTRRLLITRRH